MMTKATIAAPTVTGEREKLQSRSLSTKRRQRGGRATIAGVSGKVISATSGDLAFDAQSRIDHVIEQVDNQVDDDKKEAD